MLARADDPRKLGDADIAVAPAALAELIGLIETGKISGKLGKDVFEWQVRPDMVANHPLKDAFVISNGTLTIKNDDAKPIFLGKGKRDWEDFIVEFKISDSFLRAVELFG